MFFLRSSEYVTGDNRYLSLGYCREAIRRILFILHPSYSSAAVLRSEGIGQEGIYMDEQHLIREAERIHRETLVLDAHFDLAMDLMDRTERERKRSSGTFSTVPSLRAGLTA
jgi:hypothetical protein